MKKIFFLISTSSVMLLTSCFTVHHATNNPIGTKTGTSKAVMFSPDADFSYNKAAKKGNIQRIGSTEIRKGILGFKTTVTGE